MPDLTPLRYCLCGAELDARGLCTHCDRANSCANHVTNGGCGHCRQRDSYCAICHAWRQTPTHALECEKRHRDQERAAKA